MTLSHNNMLFLSLKFPFLTDIEKEKFQKNKKISRKLPSHYFCFSTPQMYVFSR